jgi:class 3 adenylate cyclase/tetratricopeptide (TPR) repeat protein
MSVAPPHEAKSSLSSPFSPDSDGAKAVAWPPVLRAAWPRYLPPYLPPELPSTLENQATVAVHLGSVLEIVQTYLPRRLATQLLRALLDLLQGLPEGRREQGQMIEGTLLFADISGFTATANALSFTNSTADSAVQTVNKEGVEELTSVVNDIFSTMLEVVDTCGGDLLTFGGDALLILFTDDDHPLVAVHAAQQMLRVMEPFARTKTSRGVFPLRVHIGINSGRFLAASVGRLWSTEHGPTGREYVVTGQVVNDTARAEAIAEQGQIALGPGTLAVIQEACPTLDISISNGFGILDGDSAEVIAPTVQPAEARPCITSLEDMVQALDRLAPYLPVGLLPKIMVNPTQPEIEGEHRLVTVLFANLLGMSEIVEALGPESSDEAAAILDRYLSAMQEVVMRYEGTVNKVDLCDEGDKLMVLFGAPRAHEDDPQRAVRAALEMQEAIRPFREMTTLAGTFSMRQRIGIHTGMVFAGNVGSATRKEYTVMGDTVNLAARLMAAAEVGQILISPTTHRYLDASFVCEELSPVVVKGKSEPVPVCTALGLHRDEGLARRAARHGPLVGRVAELARLKEVVGRVLGGQGQVVTIVGEAGVGKSRLVDELLVHASGVGMQVLRGECVSYGSTIPYLPWVSVLREFFGWQADDDPMARREKLRAGLEAVDAELVQWLPIVAGVLGLSEPDTQLTQSLNARLRKERFFDIVVRLLRARAQQSPQLLLFEDLHWADPISLELLLHVARHCDDDSLLLLIVHRPALDLTAWQEMGHYTTIQLEELDTKERVELVSSLLNLPDLPPDLRDLILTKAQGNPFYIEEVVHVLVDRGYLMPDDGGYRLAGDLADVEIPDTVRGAMMSRIDSLDEGSRNVLKVAACIDRVFSYSILRAIYPWAILEDVLHRRLDILEQVDLTPLESPEPDLHYQFKHILTQEVAYESLSYARRRELHGRVARYYEDTYNNRLEEVYDLLAYHYGRSEERVKALEYTLKAGDRAKAAFANDAAIKYYQEAIRLIKLGRRHTTNDLQLADTHLNLADVQALVGQYERAAENYQAALDTGGTALSAEQRARIQRKAARGVFEKRGDYDAALEGLLAACTTLEADPAGHTSRQMVRVLSDLGSVHMRKGNYQEAIRLGERALDVLDRLAEDHETWISEGWVYTNLGVVYTVLGDYRHAENFYERGLSAREQAGDLHGIVLSYNNLGSLARLQGDYERALATYQRCLEMAHRIGDTYFVAMVYNNLGICYQSMGRYSEAIAHYQDSLAIREEIGDRAGIASCYNDLGLACHHLGEYDRALDYHRRSLEIHQATGQALEVANSLINIAAVRVEQGDQQPAIADAHRAVDMLESLGSKVTLSEACAVLAQAYLAAGEIEAALRHGARAQQVAQETGSHHDDGVAHHVLGRVYAARAVCEGEEQSAANARTHFERGLDSLREAGDRFELAKCWRSYAEFLRVQGDNQEAARCKAAASRIFKELGVK